MIFFLFVNKMTGFIFKIPDDITSHVYSFLSSSDLRIIYRLIPRSLPNKETENVIDSLILRTDQFNTEINMLDLPNFNDVFSKTDIKSQRNFEQILKKHTQLSSSSYEYKLATLFFICKINNITLDISVNDLLILLNDAAQGVKVARNTLRSLRNQLPLEQLDACFTKTYQLITHQNTEKLRSANRLISMLSPLLAKMQEPLQEKFIYCLILQAYGNQNQDRKNSLIFTLSILRKFLIYATGTQIIAKKIIENLNQKSARHFNDNLLQLTIAIDPNAIHAEYKQDFLAKISGPEAHFTYIYDLEKFESIMHASFTNKEYTSIYNDALMKLKSRNDRVIATGLNIFSFFALNSFVSAEQLNIGSKAVINLHKHVKYPTKKFFWLAVNAYMSIHNCQIDSKDRTDLIAQAWRDTLGDINHQNMPNVINNQYAPCDTILHVLKKLLSIENVPSERTLELFQTAMKINFKAYLTLLNRKTMIVNNFASFASPEAIEFLKCTAHKFFVNYLDEQINSDVTIQISQVYFAKNIHVLLNIDNIYLDIIDNIIQTINDYDNYMNQSISMLRKMEFIISIHNNLHLIDHIRIKLLKAINIHLYEILTHPRPTEPIPFAESQFVPVLLSLLIKLMHNNNPTANENEIANIITDRIVQLTQLEHVRLSSLSKLKILKLLPSIKNRISSKYEEIVSDVYVKWDEPAYHKTYTDFLTNEILYSLDNVSCGDPYLLDLLGRGFVKNKQTHERANQRCEKKEPLSYFNEQSTRISLSLMSKATHAIFWKSASIDSDNTCTAHHAPSN